jgi:glycosyltransferase involved in cell wall biosynthesis
MVMDKSSENLENLTEMQRLRDLGRYYLHHDMVAQALHTYAVLLDKFPQDVATLVVVGDSYLMAGDAPAALIVYQAAVKFEPDRKDLLQRIELAGKPDSSEASIAGGFPPLHSQAINRLAERLTGKSVVVDEEQIRLAAELLEKTIHSESPAASVSEHLDEIDTLLPAILELNIRQARSQGRSDLAAELIELQRSLLTDQGGSAETHGDLSIEKFSPAVQKEPLKVVLISEASHFSPLRSIVMKTALESAGIRVEEKWEDISIPWEGYDLVIAHNPHANPIFMKALAAWAGSGNAVLVDMDTDFRIIPSGHPSSNSLNQGNLSDTRIFTAALQLADVLTFPSTQAALRFSNEGYQAFAVPDGWSEKNSLWMKKNKPSTKLNLGIFTEPGNLDGVASIRRAVIRILREFPQVRLVVSGDPEVYPLFDSIPDTRRVYLPPTEPDDFPFLLAQADIHLFPVQDDERSNLDSDRRYMEAGIRKTTWVGSPIPAAEEWIAGGLISLSMDDWYTNIKELITDSDMRVKLAQEGFDKAQSREARKMAGIWESAIQKAIQPGKPKPFLKEGK